LAANLAARLAAYPAAQVGRPGGKEKAGLPKSLVLQGSSMLSDTAGYMINPNPRHVTPPRPYPGLAGAGPDSPLTNPPAKTNAPAGSRTGAALAARPTLPRACGRG